MLMGHVSLLSFVHLCHGSLCVSRYMMHDVESPTPKYQLLLTATTADPRLVYVTGHISAASLAIQGRVTCVSYQSGQSSTDDTCSRS